MKSAVLNFCNFSWLFTKMSTLTDSKIKFLDFSLNLKNVFFSDHFLARGNLVRTRPNTNTIYHVYTCICILNVFTWSWETLMSSITSGGITSTTLVCSLGMSPVDRASVKYKTKKVRLQNDLMRHSTVTWSYLSLSVCQAEQKVPALYTVSAFPRALFNALNITRAPVLFSCCIFPPRFVQYKRYPAIHTIYTFSAL